MLNHLQKGMLEASIDFLFDSIKDCEDSALGLSALSALTDEQLFDANKEKLEQANILDAVEQLKRILQHPNPQNRSTGSSYVEQDPGMAVWKDPLTKAIKKEALGILSLTTQNNNECPPVTKQDVVEFIHEMTNRYKVDIQDQQLETEIAQQQAAAAVTGKFFAQTEDDLYLQAKQLLQQHKFNEALIYLDAAISKNPQKAKYHFERGKALIKVGRRADGLIEFNHATRLQPLRAQIWIERGFTRENLGDITGALQDYDRGLHLKPKHYFGLFRRGGLRMQLGQVQQGEQDFIQALTITDDDASLYAWRGEQYLGLERYAEALQDFNEALRLQPNWRNTQAMKAEAEKLIANPDAIQNHRLSEANSTQDDRSRCLVM